MTAIARVLEEAGHETFLPHRDGVERCVMRWLNSALSTNALSLRARIDRAIFAVDVHQIVERCDCLVFNMNGRVPDEGGVAEAAIAFAAGKPVLLYKDDARTAFDGRDNSMVTGLSGWPIVSKVRDIPSELTRACEALHRQGPSVYAQNLPPAMRATVELGAKLSRVLDLVSRRRAGEDTSELVEEIARACAEHEGEPEPIEKHRP